MNILHLTPHLNAGGLTTYIYTLAKGSIQQGHKVYVITSGGDLEDLFKEAGIEVLRMNIRTKSILSPKIYWALPRIRKFIAEHQIQILHAHTRVTQVMAHWIQKKMKVIFVSTCHGYFRAHWARRVFPCWGDATIAISREVLKHLEDDFKLSGDRIALIESGVDLEQFPLITEDLRKHKKKELGLEQIFVVGTIARLSDVKGVDILLKAVPEMLKERKDFRMLIIGQGKQEAELKQIVADLKLEETVSFDPAVQQTAAYLPVFDVFVVPSRQEGLGLSALEAQASGLAVVASKVGGLKTLIQDGQTGLLVSPEDPTALAKAILSLLADPSLRESLGKAARTQVETGFNSAIMVEKTLNLYARLMV